MHCFLTHVQVSTSKEEAEMSGFVLLGLILASAALMVCVSVLHKYITHLLL